MNDLEQALAAGKVPWDNLAWEDYHVSVYRDAYPVTSGHLLFVPKYNTQGVIADAMGSALSEGQRMVEEGSCDGFNVGLNMGQSAGQTVMYPHVHLIPRRNGDCADPTGGVRGVIPDQQNYRGPNYKK